MDDPRRAGRAPAVVWSVVCMLAVPGAAWPQQAPARLTPAVQAAGAWFGSSVAIDGDTLVVGAPNETVEGLSRRGSATVFVRGVDGWVEQARLVAADGGALDRFGTAVALEGDTLVVGAPEADLPDAARAGAAYVFTRSAGAWTQRARLVAFDYTREDFFGRALALDRGTLVVGAPNFGDSTVTFRGAAYVLTGGGASWTTQAKLLASDATRGDNLAATVAISGDTIALGAPNDELDQFAGANIGSVYVWTRSGTTWGGQTRLNAPGAEAGSLLGASLALSGDLLVAGAPSATGAAGQNNGGAVWAWRRDGAAWGPPRRISPAALGAGDAWGSAVAIDGNLLVGVRNSVRIGSSGQAHAFNLGGATPVEIARYSAPEAQSLDGYGVGLALDGGRLLAGVAYLDVAGLTDAGAAYVVEGVPQPLFGDGFEPVP